MKNITTLFLALAFVLIFAGMPYAGETCKDAAFSCICKCKNGQKETWKDMFRADTKCSGFLCIKGCVASNWTQVMDKCVDLIKDTGKCDDYCELRESKLREICAQKGGFTSHWGCYAFP